MGNRRVRAVLSSGRSGEIWIVSFLGPKWRRDVAYKALTENSEVLACDVARSLCGSEVDAAPSYASYPCTIKGAAQTAPGIVIVSSTSSLLADFQLWRADVATMGDLEMRAAEVCTQPRRTVTEPSADWR